MFVQSQMTCMFRVNLNEVSESTQWNKESKGTENEQEFEINDIHPPHLRNQFNHILQCHINHSTAY